MSLDTPFTVRAEHLAVLGPAKAVRFTAELLWAEAARLGLPATTVNIALLPNIADGGVDANATLGLPLDSGLLHEGRNVFQIKSGTFKPWQKSQLRKELFGPRPQTRESLGEPIRDCMADRGRYVLLCTGIDLTSQQRDKAITKLRNLFQSCDYDDPNVEVIAQNQLISLLKPFPSLCLGLNGSGAGRFDTIDSWASQDQMSTPFAPGEEQRNALAALARELAPRATAAHVHLRGEPGIGKTRLALEALRADHFAPMVVYCDTPGRIRDSSLLSAIVREDSKLAVILVVDECDRDARAYLWNRFKHLGSRLRFVSIYGDFEQTAGETVFIDVPPLPDEQIVEILRGYIPAAESARRWSEYCSGSPRVAHVVGLNLQRNPDDLLKRPDTVRLWDRYIVGGDNPETVGVERRRVMLRRLALFRRFGFRASVRHEAEAIAALVKEDDPSITQAIFDEIVHGLEARKILQGENTLYITPRLLHIRLWVDWWEIHGAGFVLDEFADAVPDTLLDWFFEMARYAAEAPPAEKIFSELLVEGGPFEQFEWLQNARGARFFLYLTEASPSAALSFLRRTVGLWDEDRLRQFTTGRREAVWALEKIAVWRCLFPDAARLLLRLAQAENEEHIGNNATGVFAGLFTAGRGRVAPTEAPPEERFPILKEALEHDSEECRRVGLKACDSALQIDHFSRVVGADHQGLRQQPDLWMPTTWGEWFDAYRRVWRLLEERLDHVTGHERTAIVDLLLAKAGALAARPNLTEMVVDTVQALADRPFVDRTKLIKLVEVVLRYDKERTSSEARQRWERLRDLLVSDDFPSRMKRWVGMVLDADEFDEQGEPTDRASLAIDALADEVLRQPQLLDPELAWLTTSAAMNGFAFGHALGTKDRQAQLLPELLRAQRAAGAEGTAFFLGGYFRALRGYDERAWDEQLDSAAADPELRGYVPELTWRSGLTNQAAKRVLSLARQGHIPAASFEIFSYGGVLRELSSEAFEEWISFLIDADSRVASDCAVRLCYFYYCGPRGRSALPRDLAFRVLTAPPLFRTNDEAWPVRRKSYEWTQLASAFVEQHTERAVELAGIMLEHFGEHGTIIDSLDPAVKGVLEAILRDSPAEVWDCIVGYVGPPLDPRALDIQYWLNEGPLSHIPPKLVWEWVDGDVEERASYLASFVPKEFPGESAALSARILLLRYGSLSDVRKNLIANFSSGAFMGHESAYQQQRRDQLLDWRSSETDANVILWLNEYIEWVEKRIEQAKISEERLY